MGRFICRSKRITRILTGAASITLTTRQVYQIASHVTRLLFSARLFHRLRKIPRKRGISRNRYALPQVEEVGQAIYRFSGSWKRLGNAASVSGVCGAGVDPVKVVFSHLFGLTPQLEGSANSQRPPITQSVSVGFGSLTVGFPELQDTGRKFGRSQMIYFWMMVQNWTMAQFRAMEQICAIGGDERKIPPI